MGKSRLFTYHTEKEDSWENSVDWDCDQIGELPRPIDEDINVFGHDIDNLGSLFVFNVVLAHVAGHVKDPTLYLGLYEAEVIVDMKVIVTSSHHRNHS